MGIIEIGIVAGIFAFVPIIIGFIFEIVAIVLVSLAIIAPFAGLVPLPG